MTFFKFLLALLLCLRVSPAPVMTLPAPARVVMTFVGDCMIASSQGSFREGSLNWYTTNHDPSYFLEKVQPYFATDDITVVNCETVLSDRALTERAKPGETNYWYKGPASNARIFSSSSVEVAGFANNHANDYGSQGLSDTVAALEAEGLTVGRENEPVYMEKNGITVSILACQMWYAGAERSFYKTLEEMKGRSDIQIVYVHGGGENTYVVDEWRKTAFRSLIDRGADLVLCSHAHRLQPLERYNGGTIVYGLGNFCYGGRLNPVNRSVLYRCTFTDTGEGFDFSDEIVPCYVYTGSVNNWQPCPVEPEDPVYDKILDFMNGRTASPE